MAKSATGARPKNGKEMGSEWEMSGRQFLPAAIAARGNHFAAADSRHAGAKAVTALAHKLARLIGPLHLTAPSRKIVAASKTSTKIHENRPGSRRT
jgi:hypothetical protein